MSVSPMGRRFLALLVDWLLCSVIAYGLLPSHYLTIAVFTAEVYLFTAISGITVGKRLLGIRVVRISHPEGGPIGFGWAAIRTLLLLTVVPALFLDRDLRGMHDRASETVVVRL
jgi:uncharacterized RDD family membrane protein YckC